MSEAACHGGLRVVKLGGSLLDWPEFPSRLRDWLGMQPKKPTLLIVGGGDVVEAVRKLDAVHKLGESKAHWLCIDALRISAKLLSQFFPEVVPFSPDVADRPLMLADVPWLMDLDSKRSVRPLPETWEVTTDSIAARATVLLGADELVLLKSASPQRAGSLRDLANAGYVDPHFPICAKSIAQIRLVNLRDGKFAELPLGTERGIAKRQA